MNAAEFARLQALAEPKLHWNHEGDIIRCLRDVTYDRAEEIREQYADEPLLSVVVEEG